MELAPDAYGTLALRLLAAFVLGGLLGLEREWQHRPAGLRTHILVCVASALFTIISAAAVNGNGDPSRIAAQVVTGIGFIGAGTIMRHGNVVRGLTTAASLWMVAAIGLACGVGWYPAAIFTTLIGIITLIVVDWFEESVIARSGTAHLEIVTGDDPAVLSTIIAVIRGHGASIGSLKYHPGKPGRLRRLTVRLRLNDSAARAAMCQELEALDDVSDVLLQ